jgi:hypothetical protein
MAANYRIQAAANTDLALRLDVDICGYPFSGVTVSDGSGIGLSAFSSVKIPLDSFLSAAAKAFGLTFDIPGFLQLTVERMSIDYNGGVLSFDCKFDGLLKECKFSYGSAGYEFAFMLKDFDLRKIPFIGDFVSDPSFGISGTTVAFGSDGVSVAANICGVSIKQLIKSNSNALQAAENPKIFWTDVNKSISVLTLNRAGLYYGNGALGFALDASLAVKPLTLSLLGAGLSVNLDSKDINFLISGFGVEFKSDALTIGGAFNKYGNDYSGELNVSVKAFGITLLGDYSSGHLLAYAIIGANIGGPPAFFVTGLAAGFGYGNTLNIPAIENVENFSLIKAAVDTNTQPTTLLANLKKDITSASGENFLAAGVKFTSFGIADSFALLTVAFGKRVEIALLGISTISMPPKTDNPIAQAKLALKADIAPSVGVFSVEAQLMPDSFILSKSCVLTGGFAFYLWFGDNPHSGDFVITLGGYASDYAKPAHYPSVPRLGFRWNVGGGVNISGELYFAVTPAWLMAGGRLDAIYSSGALKAWFTAYADFKIGWKPFSYSARIGVSVGASLRVDVWFVHHTFSAELSADLDVWGPDFSGKAHISWFIISFTVSFGANASRNVPSVNWNDFQASFLPATHHSITATSGATGDIDGVQAVCADSAEFEVTSVIPNTEITFNGTSLSVNAGNVGILPMGGIDLHSKYTLKITNSNGECVDCDAALITHKLPSALWAKTRTASELTDNLAMGIRITPKPIDLPYFPSGNAWLTIDKLSTAETITCLFNYLPKPQPLILNRDSSIETFKTTAQQTLEKRTAFAADFSKYGFEFDFTPSLELFAANADSLFDEDFSVGSII